MTEYTRHIEEYLTYSHSSFSKSIHLDKWGNKQLAEKYLEKYWLPEQEYRTIWKPIQDKIFYQDASLPELVYRPDFEIIALRGGCLFEEKDFKDFQKSLEEIGEQYFVVIQHSQEFTKGEPMFKMKFPVSITWEELTSGNYVSAVLFQMNYNEYLLFGLKGNWGKYSATDYDNPLDIIGFKPYLASIFNRYFKSAKEEFEQIREWLPDDYKLLIKYSNVSPD